METGRVQSLIPSEQAEALTNFNAVVFIALLLFQVAGAAQPERIKVSTINDGSPSSEEVMKLFRQKIAEHNDVFQLVDSKDGVPGLLFLSDCLPRKTLDAAYTCFYTLQYVGATGNKSLMGGGLNTTKAAKRDDREPCIVVCARHLRKDEQHNAH
jgi:hypothetical protein